MLEAKLSRKWFKGATALALSTLVHCSSATQNTEIIQVKNSTANSRVIPRDRHEICFEIERNKTKFSLCSEGITLNDLDYIADVKSFAQKEFGLHKTSNYISFREDPRTLHRLVVTSTNSFSLNVPFKNKYELEGNYCKLTPPFKIDSEVDNFKDEKECYQKKGYDVYLKTVTGIGHGSDIGKEFKDSHLARRVELIFHEDFHQTDQEIGNSLMNISLQESRAQWVGLAGAIKYFKERGDYDNQQTAITLYENWKEQAKRVNNIFEALEQLDKLNQEEGLTKGEEERINRFMKGTNMAELHERRSYTKYFVILDEIYQKTGHDHKKMMEIIFHTPKEEETAQKYLTKLRDLL